MSKNLTTVLAVKVKGVSQTCFHSCTKTILNFMPAAHKVTEITTHSKWLDLASDIPQFLHQSFILDQRLCSKDNKSIRLHDMKYLFL